MRFIFFADLFVSAFRKPMSGPRANDSGDNPRRRPNVSCEPDQSSMMQPSRRRDCGGGFIAVLGVPLMQNLGKALIDARKIKRIGIKRAVAPFKHMPMAWMFRIAHRRQEIVVAPNATNVFGRTRTMAFENLHRLATRRN